MMTTMIQLLLQISSTTSVSYTVIAQATRLASMKSAVTRALVPAGRTPSAQWSNTMPCAGANMVTRETPSAPVGGSQRVSTARLYFQSMILATLFIFNHPFAMNIYFGISSPIRFYCKGTLSKYGHQSIDYWFKGKIYWKMCWYMYICMIVVKHIYRAGKDIRSRGVWSCVKPGCFKAFLVVCVSSVGSYCT